MISAVEKSRGARCCISALARKRSASDLNAKSIRARCLSSEFLKPQGDRRAKTMEDD